MLQVDRAFDKIELLIIYDIQVLLDITRDQRFDWLLSHASLELISRLNVIRKILHTIDQKA